MPLNTAGLAPELVGKRSHGQSREVKEGFMEEVVRCLPIWHLSQELAFLDHPLPLNSFLSLLPSPLEGRVCLTILGCYNKIP